jgi:hypothetical protein
VVVGRRAGRAGLLVGLMMGLVLWLGGCGTGNGDVPSARPTTEPSRDRTTTSVNEAPSTIAAGSEPTRTPTSVEPPKSTSTRTSQTAPPKTSPKTTSAAALTPTSTSTPSAAGAPASAESGGLGALGWILLVVLVGGLIAALLISRSRRKSAWDAEAGALERDTRIATSTQLPSVLTAESPGQRALSWPPLRARLIDLMRRWDLLAERASDDQRRDRSVQIRSLLQELVAAVDAENEALATGRDWRLLRPRVNQLGQALTEVLAGVPQQEPPAGGQSGRPGPGG